MTDSGALGEFGLIARLVAGLPQGPDVLAGAGDDCAVLDAGGPEVLLATCDAQVEGIHFRLATASPATWGARALAINLSDIAAMGGAPRFALISLLLPPRLDLAAIDGLYAGLRAAAEQYGVAIVGGNVARLDERLVVDITLLGTAARDCVLLRSGARPGDAVLVTGALGLAAAGLLLAEDPALAQRLAPETAAVALAALRSPTPRIAAGQWLARQGATAALDISDGLAADLGHLCDASRVGAVLEAAALPIPAAVRAIAAAAGRDALDLALFGGEDYELLFTAPAERAPAISAGVEAAVGVPATVIGRIRQGMGMALIRDGVEQPLPPRGWDHLR